MVLVPTNPKIRRNKSVNTLISAPEIRPAMKTIERRRSRFARSARHNSSRIVVAYRLSQDYSCYICSAPSSKSTASHTRESNNNNRGRCGNGERYKFRFLADSNAGSTYSYGGHLVCFICVFYVVFIQRGNSNS